MLEDIHKTEYSDLTWKYATWTGSGTGEANDLWTPASGKKVHVTCLTFYAASATTFVVTDLVDATEVTIAKIRVAAGGQVVVPLNGELALAVDHILRITAWGGVDSVYVTAFGHER